VFCGYVYLHLTPSGNDHHWIVCTTPNRDQEIATFSLTTRRDYTKDLSCILQPGDHSVVTNETVVDFRRARLIRTTDLQSWINAGDIRPKATASDVLIQRIRKGALDSEFTSGEVQDLVRRCRWSAKRS
jgi:hypothetical protein